MGKSKLEIQLAEQIRTAGLPKPEREYRFAQEAMGRRWRFDFAWVRRKVAVEVEGGTWAHGRHNRPKGFESDCEKYNAAALLGWRVFRFTGGMLDRNEAVPLLERVLGAGKGIRTS